MINEQCAHTYCKDDITKIENYDKAINDTAQTWHIHHRLEFTLDEEFAHSKSDLQRMNMYYDLIESGKRIKELRKKIEKTFKEDIESISNQYEKDYNEKHTLEFERDLEVLKSLKCLMN